MIATTSVAVFTVAITDPDLDRARHNARLYCRPSRSVSSVTDLSYSHLTNNARNFSQTSGIPK